MNYKNLDISIKSSFLGSITIYLYKTVLVKPIFKVNRFPSNFFNSNVIKFSSMIQLISTPPKDAKHKYVSKRSSTPVMKQEHQTFQKLHAGNLSKKCLIAKKNFIAQYMIKWQF